MVFNTTKIEHPGALRLFTTCAKESAQMNMQIGFPAHWSKEMSSIVFPYDPTKLPSPQAQQPTGIKSMNELYTCHLWSTRLLHTWSRSLRPCIDFWDLRNTNRSHKLSKLNKKNRWNEIPFMIFISCLSPCHFSAHLQGTLVACGWPLRPKRTVKRTRSPIEWPLNFSPRKMES